jgi:hypothetical protein
MSQKRRANSRIDQHGGKGAKKKFMEVCNGFFLSYVKFKGPDIPSSNFATLQTSRQTTNRPHAPKPAVITSIPNLSANVQTVSKVLNNLQLVFLYYASIIF